MRTATDYHHHIIIAALIIGLILGPIIPQTVRAAEQDTDTVDSTFDDLSSGSGGTAGAGVDVSGSSGKKRQSGKGVLAPPPQTGPPPEKEPEPKIEPEPEPEPEKSAEQKKLPRAIGASAGKAGPATTDTGKELSMGWKIAAGVLGVGLLIGLAGGGGGGGGGGTTTPIHSP